MDMNSPLCSGAYHNDFIFQARFWLVQPEKKKSPLTRHMNSGLLQRREKLPFISRKVQRDKQAESMPNKLVSRYDAWQVQSITDKTKIYPARRVDSSSANACFDVPSVQPVCTHSSAPVSFTL